MARRSGSGCKPPHNRPYACPTSAFQMNIVVYCNICVMIYAISRDCSYIRNGGLPQCYLYAQPTWGGDPAPAHHILLAPADAHSRRVAGATAAAAKKSLEAMLTLCACCHGVRTARWRGGGAHKVPLKWQAVGTLSGAHTPSRLHDPRTQGRPRMRTR